MHVSAGSHVTDVAVCVCVCFACFQHNNNVTYLHFYTREVKGEFDDSTVELIFHPRTFDLLETVQEKHPVSVCIVLLVCCLWKLVQGASVSGI